MSVPVNDASDVLLDLVTQYYLVVFDARQAIWQEEYRRASLDWARYHRPSPAGIDEDRIIVTAMRWQEEQHSHSVAYANTSSLWIEASNYTSDALAHFNEVRRLLEPCEKTEEAWFAARRHVIDIERLASKTLSVRSRLFGA